MKKIFVLLFVLFILSSITAPVQANTKDQSPIVKVNFDDNELAVEWSIDHAAPDKDDTLGLIAGYPSIGFIAHDYLAGESIKGMVIGEIITLIYANGAVAHYQVYIIGRTPSTTTMGQVYYEPNEIVFQTCLDENTRFVVKAKQFGEK
jgi:hypothetical protein